MRLCCENPYILEFGSEYETCAPFSHELQFAKDFLKDYIPSLVLLISLFLLRLHLIQSHWYLTRFTRVFSRARLPTWVPRYLIANNLVGLLGLVNSPLLKGVLSSRLCEQDYVLVTQSVLLFSAPKSPWQSCSNTLVCEVGKESCAYLPTV